MLKTKWSIKVSITRSSYTIRELIFYIRIPMTGKIRNYLEITDLRLVFMELLEHFDIVSLKYRYFGVVHK